MNYCAGFIRQQENQQLGLPASDRRRVLPAPAPTRRVQRVQRPHRPHRQARPGRDARPGRTAPAWSGTRSSPCRTRPSPCTKAARRRSSPRSSRTSASRSRSSSGFALTGAASMLAEAIHSLADTGNQGLLFLGGRRATHAPDDEHPFGYGAERYFWSFVVALVLFSLGGLFALFEGIEKLLHPHEIESPAIALEILGGRVRARGARRCAPRAARRCRHGARPRGGRSSTARRAPSSPSCSSRTPVRSSGSCSRSSGCCSAGSRATARFDAVGSIAIGLAARGDRRSCWRPRCAASSSVSRPAPSSRTPIRAAITDGPEVERIIHLRTRHLGPDELLVGAKLDLTATDGRRPRGRDRHRRGTDPGRGADRPGDLHRARPLPIAQAGRKCTKRGVGRDDLELGDDR